MTHPYGSDPNGPDPNAPAPGGFQFGIGTIISGVMIVLGLFVLLRLLMRPGEPLTGTVPVDIAFGLFFLARGAIHFRNAHRGTRM